MGDRTSRAFIGGSLHARAALVGNHKPCRTHRFRGTDDGAQVAGVGDVIAHDDEGATVLVFRALLGLVDDIPHPHVRERFRLGHDALMASARRFLVELGARHVDHGNVALSRLAKNVFNHGLALRVVGHKNLLQRHIGTQRLDDRPFPLYVIRHASPRFAAFAGDAYNP